MRKIRWLQAAPFFAVHASVVLAFFVPFSWGLVALCLASYVLRMFAITVEATIAAISRTALTR